MRVFRILSLAHNDTATDFIDCLPWTIFRLDTSIPMSDEVDYSFATNAQVPNAILFAIKRDDLMRIFGRQNAWELFFDFSGSYSYDDGSSIQTGSYNLNVNNDPMSPGFVPLTAGTTEEINLPHNVVFPQQNFNNYMGGSPGGRADGRFAYANPDTYPKENILSPALDDSYFPDIYYWAPTDTYYIDLRLFATFTVNDGGSPFIPLWDLTVYAGPPDLYGPADFVGNFFWYQIEIPFYKILRVDAGDPNAFITMDLMNFYLRPNPSGNTFEFRDSNGASPIWDSITGVQLIDPVPYGMKNAP